MAPCNSISITEAREDGYYLYELTGASPSSMYDGPVLNVAKGTHTYAAQVASEHAAVPYAYLCQASHILASGRFAALSYRVVSMQEIKHSLCVAAASHSPCRTSQHRR